MKISTAIRNLLRFRDRSAFYNLQEALADSVARRLPMLVRRQVIVQCTNTAARRRTAETGDQYAGPDGLGYKEIYEGATR